MQARIYICSSLVVMTLVLFSSCVGYLPPSALHQDMTPTAHVMLKDSTMDRVQQIHGHVSQYSSGFHHREQPEMEDNDATAFSLGYSEGYQNYSWALEAAYSFGEMLDSQRNPKTHRNMMVRASGALDWHEGKWHGHTVKLQMAYSRGFGAYQDFLRENIAGRDEFQLQFDRQASLLSFGYSSYAECDFNEKHSLGFGLGFNYSTDMEEEGFRADFFNLEINYRVLQRYDLRIGGMLDGRLTPRSETGYIGLGYRFGL